MRLPLPCPPQSKRGWLDLHPEIQSMIQPQAGEATGRPQTAPLPSDPAARRSAIMTAMGVPPGPRQVRPDPHAPMQQHAMHAEDRMPIGCSEWVVWAPLLKWKWRVR